MSGSIVLQHFTSLSTVFCTFSSSRRFNFSCGWRCISPVFCSNSWVFPGHLHFFVSHAFMGVQPWSTTENDCSGGFTVSIKHFLIFNLFLFSHLNKTKKNIFLKSRPSIFMIFWSILFKNPFMFYGDMFVCRHEFFIGEEVLWKCTSCELKMKTLGFGYPEMEAVQL